MGKKENTYSRWISGSKEELNLSDLMETFKEEEIIIEEKKKEAV